MRTPAPAATACLLTLLSAGCGDAGPHLEPVGGVVTVGGKPLTSGTVSFRPSAARGNKSPHHPSGVIGPDGRYELFTVGQPGAPPGVYQVLVFADANGGGRAVHPLPPSWLTDKKYTSTATTDLIAEVVPSPEPGRYDLKLSR